jgi:hypothetical protein
MGTGSADTRLIVLRGKSPAMMRDRYRPRELLASVTGQVIPEFSTVQQSTDLILAGTRLLAAPAVAPLRRGCGDAAGKGSS